jgi:calcineurin-like phosphoesterase family protein
MIYFTADTHFCHANIIKYENRPFKDINEMNKILMNNWNNKIKSNDEVYIIGDFIFSDGRTANELIKKLNGRKYLIKGNHDSFLKDANFDRNSFAWIKDYFMLRYNNMKFVLFHYPIAVWDCKHHGSYHLYGHIHSNLDDHHKLEYIEKNSLNVGVDVNNFTPLNIDDVLNKINNKDLK